jgi:hypothetical protein
MAIVQPADQPAEEILLQELERVDEMLLEELARVDEMLLRIVAAIDQLPERIASGNGTSAVEPAPRRASTRPFDPYREDDAEAAEDKGSAAGQVARKAQDWIAATAADWEGRFGGLSLAVALLAAAIAVVGLMVAVF